MYCNVKRFQSLIPSLLLTATLAASASAGPVPDLTVVKIHSGNFTQGDVGDTYTIIVTNSGNAPTNATVSLVDTLPSGLIATGLSGFGWTCDLPTLTATRSDALAAGQSYPVLTLTVNVAANAPSSVTNVATVSGGGEVNTVNDTASDPTTIYVSPPIPSTPSGTSSANVTFVWTHPDATASGYEIYLYDNTMASAVTIPVSGGSTTSFVYGTPLSTAHSYTWYIHAMYGAAGGQWSTSKSFNVVSATVPVPQSPTGTASGPVTFTWTNTDATASGYEIYLYDNSTATSASIPVSGGSTGSYTSAPLSTAHRYSWYIRARYGVAGGTWSSSLSFTATSPIPAPQSPTGTATTNVTFTWTNTDATASGYEIYLYDTSVATSVLIPVSGGSTSSLAYPTPLLMAHSYSWYIHSVYSGVAGAWSGGMNFLVSTPTPVPQTPSGSSGAKPTFTWTPYSDPAVTGYEIYVYDFNTATAVNMPVSGAGTTSFTPTNLLAAGHSFRWFIHAMYGTVGGAWSGEVDFFVPLPAPQTPSGMSGPNVTFTWSNPDLTGTGYEIYLYDNSTATAVTIPVSGAASTSSTYGTPLLPAHSYSWYIHAVYGATGGVWSSPVGFTISTPVPVPVSPSGPTSRNVTFTWSNSDPTASGYEIYIYDYSTATAVTVPVSGGSTSSFVYGTPLLTAHSYRWFIHPVYLGNIGGTWSAFLNFNVPAPAPIAISPSGTTGPFVTFTWTVTDSTASGYSIYLYDKNTATSVTIPVSGGTTNSYVYPSMLANGHSYSWYIQGIYGTIAGTWSGAVNFNIPMPAPVSPSGSSGTNVTFTWSNPDSTATGYQIYLQDNSTSAVVTLSVSGGSTTSYNDPTLFSPAHSYSWYIRAMYGATAGVWSAGMNFSIPSPIQNVLSPSGMTPRNFTFTWSNGDPAADGYEIYVNDKSIGGATTTFVAGGATSSFASSLTPAHQYIWFIHPMYGGIGGAWSSGMNFTIISTVPNPLTPAGTSGTNVTFNWSNTDATANGYSIYLYNNTTATATTIPVAGGSTTSFTYGTPLVSGRSYTWYIQAVYAGVGGTWSNGVNFNVP